MKIIADRSSNLALIHTEGKLDTPEAIGRIWNKQEKTLSPPMTVGQIVKFGYWEDHVPSDDDDRVLADVKAALNAEAA